jgi:cobalt-zinc-cadmium efflux system membrane fusion protein
MIRRPFRPIPVLVGLSAAVLAGCGRRSEAPPPEGVANDSSITVTEAQRGQIQTDTLVAGQFNPVIVTTGTVNFNGDRSTSVIPAISGPVSRILVEPGVEVQPGQPLALVASPDFASDVAAFRKAETSWTNAQRIATLDEKLFANDALARTELDQARSDLASAEADRQAALQQLSSLGIDSASIEAIRQGRQVPGAEAAIRAPIAGTVVEKLINPGQLLQAGGSPAFTIADLSTVWVMGNVFETMIGSVANGDPVMITTDVSSDSFPGRVDNVAALVDPSSKATQVRIVVPNPKRELRQNMLVHVSIRSSKPRHGIVVPVAAVLRDDDDLPFVYLDVGRDRYNRRRITLGNRVGEEYEVTVGLKAGDVVVTHGALFLQEAGSQ